ncbi:winged helix-turn-helix transcriptional regulator [Streptomyces spongiae]|uniref:Helix-turn-helix transcriptional regulator n=1 Tax=Streptomyces spongiae TaxID=565072 RepID=A0A5N8XB89_9ACTN|nr:helix-turn-helix domain-containing protein [Streptomyces spongiae]MPY56771.1 helix-turn-helix transcriptional regulator [Streptomyces spongiae]
MAALDLFGRRWNLRIIWEPHQGPTGFRPLQQRCDGMSSSVPRQRLVELTQAGLVAQQDNSSYTLTALGENAYRALSPLNRWAENWAEALAEQSTSPQATTENEV